MTAKTKNHKPAIGRNRTTILIPVTLVLLIAMLMMTHGYEANARGLTSSNNISVTHNTNCDSAACQSLLCINDNCRSNSSQVINSDVPCYLPCLPAQPPSKSH
jgi:hypothetical protein